MFDVNSLGGKLIDNQELLKLIQQGGGGKTNGQTIPLAPKQKVHLEEVEDGEVSYYVMEFQADTSLLTLLPEEKIVMTVYSTDGQEILAKCVVPIGGFFVDNGKRIWQYESEIKYNETDGVLRYYPSNGSAYEGLFLQLDLVPAPYRAIYEMNVTWVGDDAPVVEESLSDYFEFLQVNSVRTQEDFAILQIEHEDGEETEGFYSHAITIMTDDDETPPSVYIYGGAYPHYVKLENKFVLREYLSGFLWEEDGTRDFQIPIEITLFDFEVNQ